jgi:hypothetical protein
MDTQTPINHALDMPDGSGNLLPVDRSPRKQARIGKLVCVESGGAVVWTARLPENIYPARFVAVSVNGETTRANSWSCHSVTLDKQTGKIVTSEFTR